MLCEVRESKGLQWPVVFLPALRKNRFPSRVMGGVTLRHVIPDDAIDDPARYRGTIEDETRLLYVAKGCKRSNDRCGREILFSAAG